MATKLYVGNLSFTTTEGDLKEHFATCGTVVSCNVIMDKYTNKSRGFAFVEMGSQEEANKAIAEKNGADFQGRTLTVNEAKPREDHAQYIKSWLRQLRGDNKFIIQAASKAQKAADYALESAAAVEHQAVGRG